MYLVTGRVLAAFSLAVLLLSTSAHARELRLSHQWPETDARHKAARVLMAELKKRTSDLAISIHPNSSLKIKPVEQYAALLEGKIEMAIYPISYATSKIPELSIGGLPGVPSSVEAAALLRDTEFEHGLQRLCEEKGFRILTWWWVGGGIASRSRPVGGPETVKGLTTRAGNDLYHAMLKAAGASIAGMPSSEIRTAMETGKLDVAVTSYETFMGFRIPELAKFATLGGHGIFTVLTPIIVSKAAWDSLSEDERQAMTEAAAASDIYFEATQREAEEAAVEAFTKAGVKVQPLTFDEYVAWLRVAKDSSWKDYQNISPRAAELFASMLRSFIDSGRR